MDEAKGDWTLQMDADEVVDQPMRVDIERILAADPASQPAGFWLRRKNWFLGKFLTKGGQYPDPVIRFYQTGTGQVADEVGTRTDGGRGGSRYACQATSCITTRPVFPITCARLTPTLL